jgi:hypothetical protein
MPPEDPSAPKRSQIPKRLREAVYKERVLWRQANMNTGFGEIVEPLVRGTGWAGPRLNQALLTNLIYSYFYDIDRLKDFHGMERINEAKKGAYLMKWIVRVKPIYFDESEMPEDPELSALMACINEIYAIVMGLTYAGIDLALLDERFVEPLMYQMLYRTLDEGLLAMWLDAIIREQRTGVPSR